MNLFNIISEIEKADPEILDKLNSRRDVFAALGNMSKKAALAAAPIALGSVFNKAVGQQTLNSANAVLNYALLLEYLEEDFYKQALAKTGLIPSGAPTAAIQQIMKHETAHVNLLVGALKNDANPKPKSFDFGPAFDNYANFLAYAQSLEDGGVRAYKGQAGVIKGAGNPNDYLTIALQIHSVEARHAAHIRSMRKANGTANNAPWITNAEANGAVDAIYGAGKPDTTFPAEGNIIQAGVDLTTLDPSYTKALASEAFDEALDDTSVRTVVGPFIKN
ncbi:ferritin-like domain-containing protein [Hymenobacter sp. NBH84]|uniref:ferritin-like domain-containing protein n=1 Tax=Hymenobacter sp. NBH84 TaxID=2596915 RepID=UPI0016271CF1|nr:ferritin-like domain-containing protein [Hymenobacter sp. NBH84]QNE40578.1 ferritin-like domain-containing protein [Hymenobacter sp. NBH84]